MQVFWGRSVFVVSLPIVTGGLTPLSYAFSSISSFLLSIPLLLALFYLFCSLIPSLPSTRWTCCNVSIGRFVKDWIEPIVEQFKFPIVVGESLVNTCLHTCKALISNVSLFWHVCDGPFLLCVCRIHEDPGL